MPILLDLYLLLDSAMHNREGIVVVGATNNPDVSPALIRPGRLERKVEISVPPPTGLANVLRTQLGEDLRGCDLMPLATAGEGATAAVAMEWVRAARRAARRESRALSLDDLASQILPRDNRSDRDRYRAAVHEAGHAIIGQAEGFRLISVSIRRANPTGGVTKFAEIDSDFLTQERIGGAIRMLLAGFVAEKVLCGSTSSGAGGPSDSDLARATALVTSMRASYGMADDLTWKCSPDSAQQYLRSDPQLAQAVEVDLRGHSEETERAVVLHKEEIGRLAARLMSETDIRVNELL